MGRHSLGGTTMRWTWPMVLMVVAMVGIPVLAAAQDGNPSLKIVTFQADATPPLGSPLCDGAVPPAARIDDPLSCRGIVFLTEARPLVLCAVDWVGIGNDGHEAWRKALAEAAGTSPDRVAVHCLHQHDA